MNSMGKGGRETGEMEELKKGALGLVRFVIIF